MRSASWAWARSIPIPMRYSTAAPSPTAAAASGVPASNFHGIVLNSLRRRWTSRIMSPPARNGGIASRISRRAQSAPEPSGPSTLWPEKT